MYLITKWFGSFMLEDSKIIKYKLFPKESKQLAARLRKIANNEILEEEKELAKEFKKFEVVDKRLSRVGKLVAELPKEELNLSPEIHGFKLALLQQASLELGRSQLKAQVYEDLDIIQAVNALSEINKTKNVLAERLREWYGYHFPEEVKVTPLSELIQASKSKLSEQELDSLVKLATTILELDKLRTSLEEYITQKMDNFAPNLTELAGALLGAKLLAQAGGLHKLSALPASTIQLLGAERALFRALRKHGKTPKYGLLFQHPRVHQAKSGKRGKLARVLANKLALAARADYYSKRFIADKLKY